MTLAPHAPATVASTVLDLIDRSRACLLQACRSGEVEERYRNAQLAALRATAAVLAARAEPNRRTGPRSAWVVLRQVAPELGEWADFFEASGKRLQAVDRGTRQLSGREADDHIREAEHFLVLVLGQLGLPLAPSVSSRLSPARP